ncbi:ATP-binding protein [Bdellovibrio sp. NC01]|uniref:ATP-binding protein n=1 Tax=Bdellovibrio sp. NC01 TaxID=2220073 RepID=UPI001FF06FCA|nr:ATP-binding protein [Bdellovibrio sp. NC01]
MAAGTIGYKMGNTSLERSYNDRLLQARSAKAQALKNDLENVGKTLLVTSELMRTRAALRGFLQAEYETFNWMNKNPNVQEWQEQLSVAYQADRNPEVAKAITHLHKLPLFLQSQFVKQATNDDVPARTIVNIRGLEKMNFFKLHETIHPFFFDYAERFNIDDIMLIDNTGTIVYTLQKGLAFGTNLNSGVFSSTSLGEAYRWSLNANPRTYKFIDFSNSNGMTPPVAFLVAPVFDKSQLLGAVVFQINLERIDLLLSDNHQWKKLGLQETGEVLAIGPDGLLRNNSRVFFENPTEFLKKFSSAGASSQTVKQVEQAKTTALKLGLPIERVRHYFRAEDSIVQTDDYLNEKVLASVGRVHLPGGGEWLLIAKINRDEARAPLTPYMLLFTAVGLLLLAALLLIFFMLSRRLVTPVKTLENAFSDLRQNHWDRRLPALDNDEYSQLFKDYNQLAETLEKTTEAKEILENVMHSLREVLFVVDIYQDQEQAPRWAIRQVNAAGSLLIGIPESSIISSDLKLWIDTDYSRITKCVIDDEPMTESIEGTLKKISGEKVPMTLSLSRVKSAPHSLGSFVLIANDVSRQKEIEKELKTQEVMLKESQRMSRTGSFRWEMDTGKMAWSEQLYDIFGIETTARPSSDLFRSLVVADDLHLVDSAFSEAQKKMAPYTVDVRIRQADTHEVIWIRAVGEIQYDRYGNPISSTGIIQDVTNLKRAEIALIAAKDEALKSSQAKSEFLAHMSHEIRTPMNAIMGMAELLRETKLSADQDYYVTIFCKAGEVLMALINDILDLSKIEAGEVSIENIPFDLKKLMNDLEDIMKPRALEKGIGFSFEIAKGINPHLMGDPNKLRQVLINLVSNSLKFTERGQIRLNVTKNPTKKDSLMISVSDSGVGIAPNKQHLIFQKFSQADSSITRKYGGTGLGLAISKSLVELMGGQIWFKSREGVGTTFFFTVPQREQVYNVGTMKPVPMKTPQLNFAPSVPRDPNKRVRILVADDTEDNRILFTHYLKNGPYEIVEAENGLEALNKIKSDKFDIVFMDVQMPEMDGYAATAQVREWEEHEHHGHVPIIALTAHALSDDRDKSLKAGCDDHITKPFKKDTLLGVIDRFSH